MLVFTRRIGDTFTIGKGENAVDVTIGESESGGGSVRLFFDAPHSVSIDRRELAADKSIAAAIAIARQVDESYSGDNLMWVIDQVLRQLAGSHYREITRDDWDTGVPPATKLTAS
jgi:sRNA-binding carbon storage regulator CsrA